MTPIFGGLAAVAFQKGASIIFSMFWEKPTMPPGFLRSSAWRRFWLQSRARRSEVHIAGALASNIAGWLGIGKQGRRPALLSGAAAGLAAEFNTPLSAITFVLEEIIEDLNNRGFLAQVLIASRLTS